MDNFTLAPNFFPAPSCTCGFPRTCPLPARVLRLQPSWSGRSVQMFSPPDYGYLNQQVAYWGRYMPGSSLNYSSIYPYFPCFQPQLRPVVKVEPLNEDRQREALTKTVQHEANESPGSCQPVSLTPAQIQASAIRKKKQALRQAKYAATDKGRKTRARYAASEKGRASMLRSQIKYAESAKGKIMRAVSQAKYAASDKGKKTRANYASSVRGKEVRLKYQSRYGASAAGKKRRAEIQARYAKSDKGKRTRARYLASRKSKVAKAKGYAKYPESCKDRKPAKLTVKSNVCELASTSGLSQQPVIKKEKLDADDA